MTTIAEARHLQRVQDLGCILCRLKQDLKTAAEIHHLFDPSQRSHWLTVPLCPEHHRGANGFHGMGGERPFRRRYKVGEVELLALTLAALGGLG